MAEQGPDSRPSGSTAFALSYSSLYTEAAGKPEQTRNTSEENQARSSVHFTAQETELLGWGQAFLSDQGDPVFGGKEEAAEEKTGLWASGGWMMSQFSGEAFNLFLLS